MNWSALESGVADKIYFYYAPKILGGTQSLPVAGGAGRRRRKDAIRFRDVKLHSIAKDEFAVEAWLERDDWLSKCSRVMFTGIIEELGTVEASSRYEARMVVGCSTVLSDLTEGASIAVNGVCLTAISSDRECVRCGSGA